jgi:hypothetical protein
MSATAMTIRMVCTMKEVKRVPRRRAPVRRVTFEKISAPMKNEAIEVRDLSQPQALLVGWPEAPRPRKMVFPTLR